MAALEEEVYPLEEEVYPLEEEEVYPLGAR
jgi:hypothetical protein